MNMDIIVSNSGSQQNMPRSHPLDGQPFLTIMRSSLGGAVGLCKRNLCAWRGRTRFRPAGLLLSQAPVLAMLATCVQQNALAANGSPDILWAREGGGPPVRSAWDQANAAAGDGKGGVYITGVFFQYAQYGALEMTSSNTGQAFFLVKYDASGQAVWEHHSTAGYAAYGQDAVATPDGGVVIAGAFSTPATFDGEIVVPRGPYGIGAYPNQQTSSCYFVARYDADGNRLWIHFAHGYGVGEPSEARVAVDPDGNVYLTSAYFQVLDFEGQILAVDQGGPLANGGFVAKYDAAGQWQWAQLASSTIGGYELITGFATDAEENLYISGTFSDVSSDATNTMTFGSVTLTAGPTADVPFVAKLDSTGVCLWAKALGIQYQQVKVDAGGNVYVGGGGGVIKLDPYGRQLWQQDGLGVSVLGKALFTCDPAGNVVVESRYEGPDFEDLTGQSTLGYGEGIVALSPAGQVLWAHYIEGGDGDIYGPNVYALTQDSPTSWFIAGNFETYTILDGIRLLSPWPGNSEADSGNAFVARFAFPPTNALPLITVQPQPVTTFETRPIELQVVASSISPLTYRWWFNGTPIANGTNAMLLLTNATHILSGNYSVSLSNSNGSVDSTNVAVTVWPLSELGEALNATNLQWQCGGSADWELDTNITHDGLLALRTPYLYLDYPHQDCWIETSVTGPGVLSFWWKASVSDYLFASGPVAFEFLLDGVEQYDISGETDWQARSLSIGSGIHTAQWSWTMSWPGNRNLCWLDQVSFQLPGSGGAPQITGASWSSTGQFQLTIRGPAGATYGIEACSDLKSWLPIGQLTATNGLATFTDLAAGNFPAQFYRAVVIGP